MTNVIDSDIERLTLENKALKIAYKGQCEHVARLAILNRTFESALETYAPHVLNDLKHEQKAA